MLDRDWITLYKRNSDSNIDSTPRTKPSTHFENFTKELHDAGLFIRSHSIQFGEIWAVVSQPHDL